MSERDAKQVNRREKEVKRCALKEDIALDCKQKFATRVQSTSTNWIRHHKKEGNGVLRTSDFRTQSSTILWAHQFRAVSTPRR